MNMAIRDQLLSAKCVNGKINVYESKIIVIRDSLFTFIFQNSFVGERVYFYSDIVSVEFKEPRFLMDGYIKFLVACANERQNGTGFFFPNQATLQDQNTLILNFFDKQSLVDIRNVYEFVVKKIEKRKTY